MKRGTGILILALFTFILSQPVYADMASERKAVSFKALSEEAVILNDDQLAEIRGGYTHPGGDLTISIDADLPSFQGQFTVDINIPKVTVGGGPPSVTITEPIVIIY